MSSVCVEMKIVHTWQKARPTVFEHFRFWYKSIIEQFLFHFFSSFVSSSSSLLLVGISCFYSRVDRIYFVYDSFKSFAAINCTLWFHSMPLLSVSSLFCTFTAAAAKLTSNEKTSRILRLSRKTLTFTIHHKMP